MLLSQLKVSFKAALIDEYPEEELNSFFSRLTQAYLGMSRLEVALNPDKQVSKEDEKKFGGALRRLEKHEPIQYITGVEDFFGLRFKVNEHVLIPRPETEELVQWILDDLGPVSSGFEIVDIGTGSGCIAVSLAKHLPDARVTALDISPEALETARFNAEQNQAKVKFIQQDILNYKKLPEKYDLIVSNPPYVRQLEKNEMQRNVLEHEPETALYVSDEDPLIFYREITKLAKEGLKDGGKLYFEINQYLAKETEELVANQGFEVELRKDIYGNYRMLRGIINKNK